MAFWGSKDVEVVSLLLDAGADKDLADNRGRTALMRVSGGPHAIIRLLS